MEPVSSEPLGWPADDEVICEGRPIVGYVTADPAHPEQFLSHVTMTNAVKPTDVRQRQQNAKLEALDDEALMNHVDLARLLDLPKEALRKRLDRWRRCNKSGGWQEVPDRQGRQPQHIYRIGAVRELLRKLVHKTSA